MYLGLIYNKLLKLQSPDLVLTFLRRRMRHLEMLVQRSPVLTIAMFAILVLLTWDALTTSLNLRTLFH